MLNKIKELLTEQNKKLIKKIEDININFYMEMEVIDFLDREKIYYSSGSKEGFGFGTREYFITVNDNNVFSIEFNDFTFFNPRFLFKDKNNEDLFAIEIDNSFTYYFNTNGKKNYLYHDLSNNTFDTYIYLDDFIFKPPTEIFELIFESKLDIEQIIDIAELNCDIKIENNVKEMLNFFLKDMKEINLSLDDLKEHKIFKKQNLNIKKTLLT